MWTLWIRDLSGREIQGFKRWDTDEVYLLWMLTGQGSEL